MYYNNIINILNRHKEIYGINTARWKNAVQSSVQCHSFLPSFEFSICSKNIITATRYTLHKIHVYEQLFLTSALITCHDH